MSSEPTNETAARPSKWTAEAIPDLRGKVAVVTGANSGIGLETARELCRKGAHVIMACRSPEKAEAAAADVRATCPEASLALSPLDLADLASVRAFAGRFRERHGALHILVNNAGVMALPRRLETADGFEMQVGTNHLGHFALTGLLLGPLLAAGAARVVNVSSQAHRQGRIDLEDYNSEKRYGAWSAYGRSKLSNLLFTAELDRRLRAAGHAVVTAAAHPGWTATNLQAHIGLVAALNHVMAQNQRMGALPTLRAACDGAVEGNDYYGPRGPYELWGYPKKVGRSKRARSAEDAARLWELSAELTGVAYL